MESTRAERRQAARELHGLIADGMRGAGLGRGPWTGESATPAVAAAADVTESILKSKVKNLDQYETLRWAAGSMAQSEEAREASRGSPSR